MANSINFQSIAQNTKTPGFYAEINTNGAATYQQNLKILIIGQMLSTGTATPGQPVLVSNVGQAQALFGTASALTATYTTCLGNAGISEIWCSPVIDNSAGVAATGSITYTGPSTTAGTLNLYVAGIKVQVGVNIGDTATVMATNTAAAMGLVLNLTVTATSSAGVVTLTARHKGDVGNVDVRFNYYGSQNGEFFPAGVSATVVPMTGGITNPDLTANLNALGDNSWEYWVLTYSDAATLSEVSGELTRRWSNTVLQYGQALCVKNGTLSALQTVGAANNYKYISIMGYYNSPTPVYQIAGALIGQASTSLSNDPTVALTKLPLWGVLPPAMSDRFTKSARQTLLTNGIGTLTVDTMGQTVLIDRIIMSYQFNASGILDNSYYDINSGCTYAYVLRNYQAKMSQFSNFKLAQDGVSYGSGQSIMTPNIMKSHCIALYHDLALGGIVQNEAGFKERLVCVIDANDPTRIDILLPIAIVSPLMIIAVQAEFFFDFPTN